MPFTAPANTTVGKPYNCFRFVLDCDSRIELNAAEREKQTMDHMRYSGLRPQQQEQAFRDIITGQDWLMAALHCLRDLHLPDGWIVSGGLYNCVWNVLTGRSSLNGIKDLDIFYCDKSDLSFGAEDLVICRTKAAFAGFPLHVDIKNQARVHLWFENRFGFAIPQYQSSSDSIACFSTRAYAVGARLDADGHLQICAPFGLDDLFSFRLTGNQRLQNRETHEKKAARALTVWPELSFKAWPSA
jgi:uncharacterized protein